MVMGSVDAKETTKLIEKIKRHEKELERVSLHQSTSAALVTKTAAAKINFVSERDMPSTSAESSQKAHYSSNTIKLPTVAKICDRYGLSDRSAAAVASAVLQDIGLITEDRTEQIIDKNKIRRAREKSRNNLSKSAKPETLKAIYFDGRKDKSLFVEEIDGKSHRRAIVEEHISIVQEPGSIFLGHTTPSSGSAKALCESIVDFFDENDYNLEDLVAVGCDGTVVNTGLKNGVITQLESKLGRSLQWFICQLHGNELPLRHLFQHLDGKTTGPAGFSGVLGKQIEQCEKLALADYEIISCELPDVDFNDLSSDQKYMYQICVAISSGQCPADLLNRNPGKLNHSRWLTLANRLLRLYISTKDPTSNLKELVNFILKVYAPMWFIIKCNLSCVNGPKHVWKTINLSRYLKKDLRDIVDTVIQRNSFFAHPENILLCMIHDVRPHIRELGLRRILNAKRNEKLQTIRSFVIPKLNFDADDYTCLIDWQNIKVTPPPLLHRLAINDLANIIKETPAEFLQICSFPCHTQAVERCIKLVTEASLSVVGHKKRDAFIKVSIESRKSMPQFDSKKDFKQ